LPLVNNGIISSQTPATTVTVSGSALSNNGTIQAINGGTISMTATGLSNYAVGTLTGGTWSCGPGSTFNISGASITTNNALVTLSGAGSVFAAMNGLADNSGTFAIDGGRDFLTAAALMNTGVLAAGVGSDLNVSGDLSESSAATMSLAIAGAGNNAENFGQFSSTGHASLDGTLLITLPAGYVPQPGDSFTFLTAANVTGTFAQISLPPQIQANVLYTPTSAILQILPEPALIGLAPSLFLLTSRSARRRRTH